MNSPAEVLTLIECAKGQIPPSPSATRDKIARSALSEASYCAERGYYALARMRYDTASLVLATGDER